MGNRILIIDDEQDVLDVLRQLLEATDYDVVEAHDGEEGLRAYETNDIDVIITDIMMAKKDGLELIKDVRAQSPDAKIIAISGGGIGHDMTGLEQAKELGANATFEKPFDLTDVLSSVETLCN